MLNDDEVDVYLCIFPAFYLCFCLNVFMHFCLSSWRLEAYYRGQNASDLVFPSFEIHLGKVEAGSWKGAVELGKKIVFLHPGICSERRNVGERISIGAECGISDFRDPPMEGGRQKEEIRRKGF